MKKILYISLVLLLLTACSNEREEAIYPAEEAPQLEEILNKQDTINGYRSVLNDEDILVAIDIKRMKRFNKEKIEKNLKKQLEEKFPDKEILVTGDLKVRWELEKVMDNQLNTEKLSETIEEIKSLSKEET
ncbi:YhcN/YlaJ family sporulation lipoprotein [Psychrobacillus sp. OK032]|uniref:YhcN/YlaJ family sporulation lipoprotein n=1 Tax=Psychrobacillus sp. OK032 TaxID=1884358 RepID=UPI0008CD2E4D|nr:YhcN/YlaJ family sporulation lipoprotein [Psychrobacillus sp. OK032]SER62609.1 Sporulation lipoprotein YhcN/YlaJ (Spore_YhcN_YlaJ) [Psychrobacillus sp. OK032]